MKACPFVLPDRDQKEAAMQIGNYCINLAVPPRFSGPPYPGYTAVHETRCNAVILPYQIRHAAWKDGQCPWR